jgi:argininosuccinate lyase
MSKDLSAATAATINQDKATTSTAWGGRFTEATDAFVQRFTASVNFDQRMYLQDIEGSIAHATMLAKVGVLSDDEKQQIYAGLEAVRADIEAGTFDWSV